MEEISLSDFTFLRKLAEELTGSIFSEGKKYLFDNRMVSMVKEFKYESMSALISDLKNHWKAMSRDKKDFFIDLITTHETLFFRDRKPFKILKDHILAEVLEKRTNSGKLKIYSAACSTGQEAVSLAITLNEGLGVGKKDDYDILATDISRMALAYAEAGSYSQLEIQRGLPIKFLNTYFSQDSGKWNFKKEFLGRIRYQQEDLTHPSFKIPKFDIVFCRNVTIYMDAPRVRAIYEHFHKILQPWGYIFVGSSESMLNHSDLFKYQKTPAGIAYSRV